MLSNKGNAGQVMRVSVITVCLNSKETIEDTIKSVRGQDYADIEHIVIDGGSTDGTVDILRRYEGASCRFVSEPDDGIYDAMNKGLRNSTGQIIAFLNSDDTYAGQTTISKVVATIRQNGYEALYGDIEYVDGRNFNKVVRYWRAGDYKKGAFYTGWVPPHPTFFCKRELFEEFGCFDTTYRVAGDFELMFRFVETHRIKVGYIPTTLVKMRTGGRANRINGIIRGNREIIRVLRANGVKFPLRFFLQKPFRKVLQLFESPA